MHERPSASVTLIACGMASGRTLLPRRGARALAYRETGRKGLGRVRCPGETPRKNPTPGCAGVFLFGVASLLEQSQKPRKMRRHEPRLVLGEGLSLPRNVRSSSAAIERDELLSVGVLDRMPARRLNHAPWRGSTA